MSLRQQSRIMAAQQSGAFDAALTPTTIIDGRDLVAALQIAVADYKASAARDALMLPDDRKADILGLTALESAARANVILGRLGIDARALVEALA